MTCKAKQENNGVCPHHNLQCGWPKCNELEQEPVAYCEIHYLPEPCAQCTKEHEGYNTQTQPEQEPNGLAAYVIGCFGAAEAEGLQEVLSETTDERLKDLVERRLMYALYEAQKPQPKEPNQEPVAYQQLFNAIAAATKTPYEGAVGISVSAFEENLGSKVYTTPPQRKPLTDEQIDAEHDKLFPAPVLILDREKVRKFARSIVKAAHGIKE